MAVCGRFGRRFAAGSADGLRPVRPTVCGRFGRLAAERDAGPSTRQTARKFGRRGPPTPHGRRTRADGPRTNTPALGAPCAAAAPILPPAGRGRDFRLLGTAPRRGQRTAAVRRRAVGPDDRAGNPRAVRALRAAPPATDGRDASRPQVPGRCRSVHGRLGAGLGGARHAPRVPAADKPPRGMPGGLPPPLQEACVSAGSRIATEETGSDRSRRRQSAAARRSAPAFSSVRSGGTGSFAAQGFLE